MRWLLAFIFLATTSYGQDITSLTTYVTGQIPNNNTRQVTPANVRNSILAFPSNQFISTSVPISTSSYVTATTYYGDGSHLTGVTGGSSTTPGGVSGSVQFNNGTGNTLGGDSFFTYLAGLLQTTSISASNISSTGPISASTYYGDGSHLTGISAGVSSYNSLTNIPTVLANISNSTGSVTVTTISSTNAYATTTSGTYGYLTFVSGTTATYTNGVFTNVAGTLSTAAQPNITSLGTQTNVTTTNLTASGLISGSISGTNGYFRYVSATQLAGDCSLCTNIPSGGTPQSIISSTTRVDARSDGTISFTTGGVVTGYMDASGRFVLPGISVTTNQTSLTSLSINGNVSITSVSGSTTGLNLVGNANNFYQLNLQNTNAGGSASSDYVATADNGTATTHYVNLGINGSTGSSTPFTAANAAYLYSTDSELDIGALGSGALITFNVSGGTTTPTEKARITANGISTSNIVALGNISATGGISATNFQGNGALLTNIAFPISATQNVASASIYVGRASGGVVTSGINNATLGDGAFASATTASNNVAVGTQALASDTTNGSNTAVGYRAMFNFNSGNTNDAFGNQAFGNISTLNNSMALGTQAGQGSAVAGISINGSVFVGAGAGGSISSSSDNVMVGVRSGLSVTTGNSNTFIGRAAGYSENSTLARVTTGSNNIAIGAAATVPSATGSNQLSIGNSIFGLNLVSGSNALIGLGTQTPTTALEVSGTVSGTAGSFASITVGSCTGCGSGGGTSISTTTFTAASNTSNSTAIGVSAYLTGTGINNTVYGASAGRSQTTGASTTLIGYNAGRNFIGSQVTALGAGAYQGYTGSSAGGVAIGYRALAGNDNAGANSIAIGTMAMEVATGGGSNEIAIGGGALGGGTLSGSRNTAIGTSAGTAVTTGVDNILIGDSVAGALTTGKNNIVIGTNGLTTNATTTSNTTAVGHNTMTVASGVGNTAFGFQTGLVVTTGGSNTLVGSMAGTTLTTGSNNIVIGAAANTISATVSNDMNIGNAIYGNIGSGTGLANLIGINVTSPTAALEVSGSVKFDTLASAAGTSYLCLDTTTSATSYSNTTCTVSDQKFKTNIADYHGALDKVLAMEVREFEFKNPAYGKGKQVGLIAQEVQQVAPALVSKGSNGDLSVDYAKLSVYAVGAIQELNIKLAQDEEEVKELRAEVGLPPKHTTFGERLHWLAVGN